MFTTAVFIGRNIGNKNLISSSSSYSCYSIGTTFRNNITSTSLSTNIHHRLYYCNHGLTLRSCVTRRTGNHYNNSNNQRKRFISTRTIHFLTKRRICNNNNILNKIYNNHNSLFLKCQSQQSLCRLSSTSSSSSSPSNNTSKNVMVLGGLSIIMGTSIYYYLHDLFGGMEGIKRSVSFYTIAIPKYIEYRYHMLMESNDDTWDDLHTKTSKIGLNKMLELQGFYIKSGQMCAANIGNAFPPIWQDTMSILQDEVPHKSFDVIKGIIENEYGCSINDIFDTFDTTPIGAASIGQVHRATLKKDVANKNNAHSNNRNVVVKVMYPEAEQYFRGDVRTIKLFAQLAQPVHVPALNEIEKQFLTEFDYVKEAEQLDLVRNNILVKSSSSSSNDKNLKNKCTIPKPYLGLCKKRVLVMEELNGEKLVTALKNDLINNAKRSNMTVDEFTKNQKEKEQEYNDNKHKNNDKSSDGGEYHGPSSKQYDTYIKILNMKRIISNINIALYNNTIGLLSSSKNKKEYIKKSTLPLNHAKLIDDLIYIHGHEVLVDGCFNGDPHPGNILLVDVDKGKPKLGLIDYGQVPRINKEKRLLFCKLVIALADDNYDDIISLMKDAGYKSKDMNKDIIYKYAKVGYDEDNDELTGGKHIQLFMEDIQSIDPIINLPKDFLMVSRCSILLRGLAHALHQPRSIAKIWKPIAQDVLEKEGLL